ncbi:MAG: hypothetical protein BWK79_13440 [Beggiatoa sp. IS2]|nr:MAG: hypothetical protein BWK79_13440 [Beggiatoa sp. IS2]
MRYFSGLLFLLVASYLAWPYFVVFYQLDNAIILNDQAKLEKLIDLSAVRTVYKETLENNLKNTVGGQNAPWGDLVRQGVQAIGNPTIDATIDYKWVRERLLRLGKNRPLQSFADSISFAFYESPTRFTARIGKLGDNPTYVQLILQDWSWRVTAIYE